LAIKRGFAGMTALLLALMLAGGSSPAGAVALDPKLPAYEPGAPVSGVISVAGNHATDDVMKAWAAEFARFHPGVSLRLRDDTRLTTDAFDVAIAAGDIDLIPSARELVPSESERLTRKLGAAPLVVAVATGSYDTKSGTHAIAFYVNAANPLERISLAQLREIYTPGGRITKWGQLGLAGEWAEQPIRVFSVPISDPNGNPLGIINFLQTRVFRSAKGLRRSLYQVDSNGPRLEQHMLNRIVRQVAEDRYAIGFSGFAFGAPGAKTLALAETDAGPWYRGTHEEVANRLYPLTRTIYLGVNQPAGKELRAPVREFLRFILSREGQATFTEGTEKYLPLTAEVARRQLKKLGD
jgi:phosphate transport system substrate-binding protein